MVTSVDVDAKERERLLALDKRKTKNRLEFPVLRPKDQIRWDMVRAVRFFDAIADRYTVLYGVGEGTVAHANLRV